MGWVPYRSETVDGELEEAYRLCPNCQAPRYCVSSRTCHPFPRPGTVCYGLDHYRREHMEVVHFSESVEDAHQAIYYLRRWLWIARDRANRFLELKLSEALSEAETLLGRAEREID